MDWDLAIKAASFAMSIGAVVYAWFAARRKDVDGRMTEIAAQNDHHERRLSSLEQVVDDMPGRGDVHRLELAMSDMTGEMKAIGAHIASQKDIMRRLESAVNIHQDHLMNGGRK